jgi:hypothetical protein
VVAPKALARARGRYPFFTKENAKEMSERGHEARRKKARERAVATRSDMQEMLLPNVERMISRAIEDGDQSAFWRAFEHAFGRAPESIEVQHEGDVTIVVRSAFVEPVIEGSASEEV